MNKNKIIIFGNGEIADLAMYYFKNDSDYLVNCFCVDDEKLNGTTFNNLPVYSKEEILNNFKPSDYLMHIAISYKKMNLQRAEKFKYFKDKGYNFASYVSTKSVYWNDIYYGENCFILENQTIQPKVKIGNNVMIWSGNHIGHGSIIRDHTYISSHVVISGNCQIGEKCFFGVNSTIKDFTKIGNECFVGMGATVSKNLSDNTFVLPPKSGNYDQDHKLSVHIKKNYFNF